MSSNYFTVYLFEIGGIMQENFSLKLAVINAWNQKKEGDINYSVIAKDLGRSRQLVNFNLKTVSPSLTVIRRYANYFGIDLGEFLKLGERLVG